MESIIYYTVSIVITKLLTVLSLEWNTSDCNSD